MVKEHTLMLIMGRTGSGKDSLVNKLSEKTNLTAITSYTTRPRRKNEGNTHIFVTEDIFEEMMANGEVAVYTEINGNHYWTTIDQLYSHSLYIIDPYGVGVLKSLNLPNLRLITVFINTPDSVREDRAINQRKDDSNTFRSRNIAERNQFRTMLKDANFDYAIPNIELPKAVSVLKWIASVEQLWMNHVEVEE